MIFLEIPTDKNLYNFDLIFSAKYTIGCNILIINYNKIKNYFNYFLMLCQDDLKNNN